MRKHCLLALSSQANPNGLSLIHETFYKSGTKKISYLDGKIREGKERGRKRGRKGEGKEGKRDVK